MQDTHLETIKSGHFVDTSGKDFYAQGETSNLVSRMTLPRSAQVSLTETPFYHCVARCVRRAFLCGQDAYTGKNFEHRRQWLLDRIKRQADVFAIDICAYAIMSNHYHLVLSVDQQRAIDWSDAEVIQRWTRLFRGPILIQRWQAGDTLTKEQQQTVSDIAAVWRTRLSDLSWYMRCLNEYIARQANAEDECTGRFWEGRFKSQALLGRAALLSCMAYVDLNPVRAGVARSLKDSDFTSVQERLARYNEKRLVPPSSADSGSLMPFSGEAHLPAVASTLPFRFEAYLGLVEATGRQVLHGKRGYISTGATSILNALNLSPSQWEMLSLEIQAQGLLAIGDLDQLRAYSLTTGRCRTIGSGALQAVFGK